MWCNCARFCVALQIDLQVEEPGERLDLWLAEELPDYSRSRLQKLISQGRVQLNHRVCTCKKERVHPGDHIQIQIPEAEPLDLQAEAIPLDVLYEDDSLLIINKPAGLVVHPAPGHSSGTLVNALLAHCQTSEGHSCLSGIGGIQRPGIVHRLDKDTSGAMAVAKTDQAHLSLQTQFQNKTARRDYLAVVYGAPAQTSGTIDQPIGRHPSDRKKMAVVPEAQGGRRAVTHWRVEERLGNYTLINFELETGRTHQIRVHAAQMGHPVVGDPVYSGGRFPGVNLPGQALHAWRLRLTHPLTGVAIATIAPLPSHLITLLEVLRRRVVN